VSQVALHALTSAESRFEAIAARIECPFARHGRHLLAPEWSAASSIEENVERIAADLRRVLEQRAECDGYVVEIGAPHAPSSVEELGVCLRQLLCGLSSRDPSGTDCMRLPVETKGWWFRFGRERFFVLTLSSVYPANHSRSTFGVPGTFVVLQSESAFDRVLGRIGAVTPALRERIRRAFEVHGRGYDSSLSESPYEAHRYVKPMVHGEPVVRWWSQSDALDKVLTPTMLRSHP
jgi:FPC/CPF motif-containing protein YcgG